MIPSEIAALADALSKEFGRDFGEAVSSAVRVARLLREAGYVVQEQSDGQA